MQTKLIAHTVLKLCKAKIFLTNKKMCGNVQKNVDNLYVNVTKLWKMSDYPRYLNKNMPLKTENDIICIGTKKSQTL